MDNLLKLGEQLLLERVLGGSSPLSFLSKLRIAAYIFASLFALAGVVAIFIGLHLYILQTYQSNIEISLILGSLYVVTSLLIIYGINKYTKYKKIQYAKKTQEDVEKLILLAKTTTAELDALYKESPESFCIMAFFGGLISKNFIK